MSGHEALLLIGHGSRRYPDAGRALHRHAASLRDGAWGGPVRVCMLNGAPSVREALDGIAETTIRVVPFFMEDGYFTRVAVPRALGVLAETADLSRRVVLCPPVGIHDGMAGVIERRALAACSHSGLASRDAAVVIIGHGSASEPGRALALHRHAARVASTMLFVRVEAACLEEPPFVAGTLSGLRSHPVVILGFFANQGGHIRDDIPALVAAERAARGHSGRMVRFDGLVADDPAMVEIILDQATSEGSATLRSAAAASGAAPKSALPRFINTRTEGNDRGHQQTPHQQTQGDAAAGDGAAGNRYPPGAR